jgi:hypothetical protein
MGEGLHATKEAKVCFDIAEEMARKNGLEYIGTECLLWAISTRPSKLISALGIDHQEIRNELKSIIDSSTAPEGQRTVTLGPLPYSPRAKRALELVHEVTGSHPLDVDDILYAIADEAEGIGSQVLTNKGYSLESIKHSYRTAHRLELDLRAVENVVASFRRMVSTEFATLWHKAADAARAKAGDVTSASLMYGVLQPLDITQWEAYRHCGVPVDHPGRTLDELLSIMHKPEPESVFLGVLGQAAAAALVARTDIKSEHYIRAAMQHPESLAYQAMQAAKRSS